MVLNKYVEFEPKSLGEEKTVGQVFLKGIDISQQMIRDGAAWYAVQEKSIHNENESKTYQSNETLAKNEKRGVWSIPDLKPAWEFRAEKEEKLRQEELRKQSEEKERLAKIKAEAQAKAKAEAEARQIARAKANKYLGGDASSKLGIELWQDSNEENLQKKPGFQNLFTGYLPEHQVEYTFTGANFSSFKANTAELKIESRAIYLKKDNAPTQLQDIYVIGFLSESVNGAFSQSNDLTIFADKQKISLGKAVRFYRETGGMMKELLLYKISEDQIKQLSKSASVSVKLGTYAGSIGKDYKQLMKDLIESTE
jgi:hypothetical protein